MGYGYTLYTYICAYIRKLHGIDILLGWTNLCKPHEERITPHSIAGRSIFRPLFETERVYWHIFKYNWNIPIPIYTYICKYKKRNLFP